MDRPTDLESLADQLRVQIVDTLELDDIEPHEIEWDAPFFREGLGLDSIDAVELVAMLEARYGIRLTDMESTKSAFASLRTLVEFVATHRGPGATNGDG